MKQTLRGRQKEVSDWLVDSSSSGMRDRRSGRVVVFETGAHAALEMASQRSDWEA